MRNKLLLVLGLLVAFSSASFAQTADHDVTLNLTESRTLVIAGAPATWAIKRSVAHATVYTNASATIAVTHDIAIAQRLTVEVMSQTGSWVDRSLSVTAPVIGGGTPAVAQIVSAGVVSPPATQLDVVTNIAAGTHAAVPLQYSASAGSSAVPSATPSVVGLRYTIMD